MHPQFAIAAKVAGLAALTLALTACNNPPKGNANNRISTTTTTAGEARSNKITTTSLIEASDSIAQKLAADVQRISSEVGGKYRVTVVFGDLENKTSGVVNTTDFELLRERMITKLSGSGMFRENVKFIASRAKLEELNRRELGGKPPDLLQEGSAPNPNQPNPAYTLFLNGSMYGSFREGTTLYYLNFKLIKASDGEQVFAADYEVKRG